MPLNPDRLLDYREYPVLFVDDERENLRIFELSFGREFRVTTAASADEALAIVHSVPIAVVLSDHRMEGMSGVELLARIREIEPKALRILVTAYGDTHTLAEAINNGAIYRYVAKPWQPDELRGILRQAIEVFALDREREQLLRELKILNRVARSLNRELALDVLLDRLVATLTEDLGYDGATLFLFDADGERLEPVSTAPPDGEAAGKILGLALHRSTSDGFVQRLRDGQVQHLTSDRLLDLDRSLQRFVSEVAADELLWIPLVGRETVIGALAVDNRRGGRSFDSSDLTLLEGLAAQAVIAIENARLVEDLRRSREHVRRADRLGTLGTLAAGLAHEINNPLVSIHTFLTLAPSKRSEDDPEFWQDYHALACREVERIRRLVSTMGQLGRSTSETPAIAPCDPGEVAEDAAALLATEAARKGVDLQVERDLGVPKVMAVRDHLHQVVVNLLLNALHATPAGGQVRLRVLSDARSGRPGVCLEVSDTGCGIAEEDLERIFDPFFTTKEPSQGSGLGLMICHRLVSEHGGTIEVSSRPGQGSTFRVRLPVEGGASATGSDPPEGG